MRKIVISLGLILLLVVLVLVKTFHSSTKNPTTSLKVQPLPKEFLVTLTTNGYSPSQITVGRGNAVRWTNQSGKKASVNSDDYPTNRLYPELNLGQFGNNSTLVHIFTTPGTYTYHNQFQPNQKGIIIVE